MERICENCIFFKTPSFEHTWTIGICQGSQLKKKPTVFANQECIINDCNTGRKKFSPKPKQNSHPDRS